MNSIATILVGNILVYSVFLGERGRLYIFPVLYVALEVMGKYFWCLRSNLSVAVVMATKNASVSM